MSTAVCLSPSRLPMIPRGGAALVAVAGGLAFALTTQAQEAAWMAWVVARPWPLADVVAAVMVRIQQRHVAEATGLPDAQAYRELAALLTHGLTA